MRKYSMLVIGLCFCAVASLSFAGTAETSEKLEKNKQTAIAAVKETLGAGDASKVDVYFADPYIQHNPMAPSGVAAFKGLIESMAAANNNSNTEGVKIIRVLAEGDLVAMHNVWNNFGPVPLVSFDVFRFNESGKIVEHWDNMQPVADEPNLSGRTQIDGTTEVSNNVDTQASKQLVVDLITRGLINHEEIDYTKFINPTNYQQHNIEAGDGLDGFGALMGKLAKENRSLTYNKVGVVVAEGDHVLIGSEGKMGDTPTAFYDLFRLEDGLIVEHWDVIAEIPTTNLAPGWPGKF